MKLPILLVLLTLVGAAAPVAYPEGQVDVMVEDTQRFSATGGLGFQRFVKDTTERGAAPSPQDCFACHHRLKTDDLVLSAYRP